MKEKVQYWTAVGLTTVGCLLFIASMAIKPYGVIDTSVLTAFGEIGAFAGALFGIHWKYKYNYESNKKVEDNGNV